MPEGRATTLLEFAIAASAAVVPVLLLVLLVVGVVRPLDPAGPTVRNGDRHVSVRQVAALKTFERAIVRRDTVTAGPPHARLLLEPGPPGPGGGGGAGGGVGPLPRPRDPARAAARAPAATGRP